MPSKETLKKIAPTNPFAICHHAIGGGKTKKYEDCVEQVTAKAMRRHKGMTPAGHGLKKGA